MCLVAFGETADRRDMVPAEGGVRGQALRHNYIQKKGVSVMAEFATPLGK